MDDLARQLEVFRGRRVLLTGDTGFKGSWLALWLNALGAEVYGYALPPKRLDDHFSVLGLDKIIAHREGDIRDLGRLQSYFAETRPEFVFHLAAQALVRRSYVDPKETFDVNVGGSVNVLECVRNTESVKALVYVTSDKCYQNNEWVWGYRESDALGGHDPYSASKAAAEIVFSSYRDSFFQVHKDCGIASVRAGNVIGGGDWSEDRVIPDCMRALTQLSPVVLRKPHATRPWQHVLEPLSGYLLLASRLYHEPREFSGAWNFGPRTDSSRSVHELARAVVNAWGSGTIEIWSSAQDPHEAALLHLNCDKAELLLKWRPRWGFARTVQETVAWYMAVTSGKKAFDVSTSNILSYLETAHD